MPTPKKLTRRAALLTAFGLSLAPVVVASSAAARGGPDPWKPKRKPKKAYGDKRLGGPRKR